MRRAQIISVCPWRRDTEVEKTLAPKVHKIHGRWHRTFLVCGFGQTLMQFSTWDEMASSIGGPAAERMAARQRPFGRGRRTTGSGHPRHGRRSIYTESPANSDDKNPSDRFHYTVPKGTTNRIWLVKVWA